MNQLIIGGVIIMMFFTFMACSNDVNSPKQGEWRELSSLEKSLVDADNQFGLKMFRQINEAEKGENLFISPLSISFALGMTLNGADGETKEAMRRSLELNDIETKGINESYQSLMKLLSGLDPKVVFTIANSIWYRQEFQVEQSFIDVNKTYFNAQVNRIDFAAPSAPGLINTWVDDNTNGKIKKIVENIPQDMVMYLINAIYFKGTWTNEFAKNLTRDDQFKKADSTTIPCKMMRQDRIMPYLETENFQAVDLPYGDGDYSMTVILPTEDTDIDAFISNLTIDDWQKWTQQFSEKEGNLQLPKFTLEYEKKLNDILIDMGMAPAFDPNQADFSKINKDENLVISEVKHKTYVKVDEEGTEAAAVTSVGVALTSVNTNRFYMRVDRPFVFAIRERNSGTILFIGKIEQP